jgi:5'-methylthioadenosine phosphorylase
MIGIIGGTGLYQIEGIDVLESREVETPFGRPSAPVLLGRVGASDVAFLPRHGKKHEILPGEINFRANIWALKSVGVRRILSVSAVGSLSEKVRPGELVIPDQYLDFTKGRRVGTFFGDGLVAHVSTAEPSCSAFAEGVEQAAGAIGVSLHRNKTYACVDGPRLGTRAESFFLRNAGGAHIVGMTNVPEAFLAREAQLCYCTLAVVTDYDCWMDDPSQHASVDKVMALYQKNIDRVKTIIERLISNPSEFEACSCGKSLEFAVLTREESLRPDQKKILEFLRT